MKLAQLLPAFLRRSDPSLSAPILSDFNLPRAAPSPFEAMENQIAELIATETQAKAAHEAAVAALNDHIAKLRLTLESHLKSVEALYTRVPQVTTEKIE